MGKLEDTIKDMFPILEPKHKVSDSRRVELLELVEKMKEEFPQFKHFTHEPLIGLKPEEFLDPIILEVADLYGYIMAVKEFKKKWFSE